MEIELFGLGWALHHGGYLGGAALIFFMAIPAVISGLYYVRKNTASKEDREIDINVFIYASFLWGIWLMIFGIQFWIFRGFGDWMVVAVMAAVGSVLLSIGISADVGTNLVSEKKKTNIGL